MSHGIHICWLQPKSTTKGDFFHIFLFLIFSSSWRMVPFDVLPSFLVTTWTLPSCQFWQDNRTHNWMFSDCIFFPGTFSMFFNCHRRSLFNEAAYLAALRQLCSPFAIRDADSKQSKTKIYDKNHLLLWILAVISRYGSHDSFNDCDDICDPK